MKLEGKRIVVTGGSDGIGRHICLKLAEQGCHLAILGRDKARLGTAAEEASGLGATSARSYCVDFMDSAGIASAAALIIADLGGVDILINNAGIWHKAGPLDSISDEMLHCTVQTNLTAAMQLTQKLLPSLRAQGEAAIVNVVSKSGVLAQAGLYQSGTNTGMFAKAGEDVPNDIFTEPGDLADVVIFMLSRPAKLWMHDVRIEL
ncbi:SDR family NAD(P)-dependent oxidoreductase [Planktotalea arctica]|uniref:SDR family NAD(P)-dependent oxidoreductase n=1 Tax=Planktotalea arctica TaxID=1481893 RepID=UPI000A17679F|nr:SDR family oxidoreductase [Planktotalea arctica]